MLVQLRGQPFYTSLNRLLQSFFLSFFFEFLRLFLFFVSFFFFSLFRRIMAYDFVVFPTFCTQFAIDLFVEAHSTVRLRL